jgi:hypothetical protein
MHKSTHNEGIRHDLSAKRKSHTSEIQKMQRILLRVGHDPSPASFG